MQNIPSHERRIRMLFKAGTTYKNINTEDNTAYISKFSDVLVNNNWINISKINPGDLIIVNEDDGQKEHQVFSIELIEDKYKVILI